MRWRCHRNHSSKVQVRSITFFFSKSVDYTKWLEIKRRHTHLWTNGWRRNTECVWDRLRIILNFLWLVATDPCLHTNVKLPRSVSTGETIFSRSWRRSSDKFRTVRIGFVYLIRVAGLPENTIRDLNDEVNRLIRSKGHWEHRIRELGGVIMDMADQLDTDSDDSSALFVGGGNAYK